MLAGKPKLSPFLVNWENVVFIYSIFFIIWITIKVNKDIHSHIHLIKLKLSTSDWESSLVISIGKSPSNGHYMG